MNETDKDRSEDEDYSSTSWFEQCLGSLRRLTTYAQEAQRDGRFDFAEFVRRAQAEARRRPGSADGADAARRAAETVTVARPASPSHDEIAERAFGIYQRERGDDVENWLRAERELRDDRGPGAKREPDPPAPGES